jgi:multidrug efflux pump subunit AcrA (membrane-fusion protein)
MAPSPTSAAAAAVAAAEKEVARTAKRLENSQVALRLAEESLRVVWMQVDKAQQQHAAAKADLKAAKADGCFDGWDRWSWGELVVRIEEGSRRDMEIGVVVLFELGELHVAAKLIAFAIANRSLIDVVQVTELVDQLIIVNFFLCRPSCFVVEYVAATAHKIQHSELLDWLVIFSRS